MGFLLQCARSVRADTRHWGLASDGDATSAASGRGLSVELSLLSALADATSWQLVMGWILATAVLGAVLSKLQRARSWRRVHELLAANQMPAEPLLDGLLAFVAGLLLLGPGLLGDLLGFALLTPWFRRVVKRWLSRRVEAHLRSRAILPDWPTVEDSPHEKIIDVRFSSSPVGHPPDQLRQPRRLALGEHADSEDPAGRPDDEQRGG